MCILRTNIVANCKKCKSSIRPHCTLKKKTTSKIYTSTKSSSKKRGE